MERLSFGQTTNYSPQEAAIHVARYALARAMCRGKRVLDIACGEGYGSRLLLDWGAAEVVGVDVSPDAVRLAEANFSTDRLRYVCCNAEDVDKALDGESFDLIISTETIEHILQPERFLRAISRLRAEGSSVLLTCPNDWWYYPGASQGNKYHARKYTQPEFMELTTKEFGEATVVGVGLPLIGYINISIAATDSVGDDRSPSQLRMMELNDHCNVLRVPGEPGGIKVDRASYFVAGWGPDCRHIDGAAVFPVSMTDYAALLSAGERQEVLQRDLQRDIQKFRVQAHALLCETEIMQESIAKMAVMIGEKDKVIATQQAELCELQRHLEALAKRWRLVTVVPRKLVPGPFISVARRIARSVLRSG